MADRRTGTPSVETLLADIRGKCIDCCGNSRKLVDACTDQNCRLWRHRHGLVRVQTAMFAEDKLEGQLDMFELEE